MLHRLKEPKTVERAAVDALILGGTAVSTRSARRGPSCWHWSGEAGSRLLRREPTDIGAKADPDWRIDYMDKPAVG
jgi:hypothetical protein